MPPEAGDDAVGCARVLHFDHRALPRLVDEIARLHDHAVEAGALEAREPLGGHGRIARRRREMDRRLRGVERELEAPPALVLRRLPQILAVERERVEGDERRGRLLRELRHARRRRMKPQLQRVEVEAVRRGDDDLAVDH